MEELERHKVLPQHWHPWLADGSARSISASSSSIVGTRLDLQESLDFAADGKVKATISTAGLDDINSVFDRMRQGQIEGRVVLDMTQ